MGQSGTFMGGINGNYYRLRVDWEAEQNISGNYSTVICRMYLEQDRYYSLNIGSRSSTTTIDGVGLNYSSAAINNDGGTTVSLGTVSRTVPHESDGTKIISISSNFYINATIKGVKYTYVYADSGSITLNTIPRKSAVSCPAEVNVDSSLPITISPHSSAFRHTLTYQLAGGNVQSIDTQLGGGVYSWSTAGLARQMPETAKKTCTITCITYSGSTEIGREPVTCQVIVPDNTSYKPVLKDTDIKISDAAGYHTTYGSYVQGKSRLRIVLSAAGKEGSPIRSGTVTVGETTLNGLDVTTPPLSEKGNVTVKATVTDGRGHPSAEASRTIAVLPYSAPSLSRLSVERCTETGVPDDEGGYAKIRFDYTFSNLNDLNKGYITIQKRQEEATSWTDVVTNVQLNGYTGSYELAEPTVCDPDKAFDIQVSIHDTVTTSDLTLAAMLPTAKTVFDILADGTGIAFGKVAGLSNTFDCAWTLKPSGGITGDLLPVKHTVQDIGVSSNSWRHLYAAHGYFSEGLNVSGCAVMESGSGTNSKPGQYIKFYDGTMICYVNIQQTLNIDLPKGTLYYRYAPTWYYPASFLSETTPTAVATSRCDDALSICCCGVYDTYIHSLLIHSPLRMTNYQVAYSVMVIGRWK